MTPDFLPKKSWHTINLGNQEKARLPKHEASQEEGSTAKELVQRQMKLEREPEEVNHADGDRKRKYTGVSFGRGYHYCTADSANNGPTADDYVRLMQRVANGNLGIQNESSNNQINNHIRLTQNINMSPHQQLLVPPNAHSISGQDHQNSRSLVVAPRFIQMMYDNVIAVSPASVVPLAKETFVIDPIIGYPGGFTCSTSSSSFAPAPGISHDADLSETSKEQSRAPYDVNVNSSVTTRENVLQNQGCDKHDLVATKESILKDQKSTTQYDETSSAPVTRTNKRPSPNSSNGCLGSYASETDGGSEIEVQVKETTKSTSISTKRYKWSNSLHEQFVSAIFSEGLRQAASCSFQAECVLHQMLASVKDAANTNNNVGRTAVITEKSVNYHLKKNLNEQGQRHRNDDDAVTSSSTNMDVEATMDQFSLQDILRVLKCFYNESSKLCESTNIASNCNEEELLFHGMTAEEKRSSLGTSISLVIGLMVCIIEQLLIQRGGGIPSSSTPSSRSIKMQQLTSVSMDGGYILLDCLQMCVDDGTSSKSYEMSKHSK